MSTQVTTDVTGKRVRPVDSNSYFTEDAVASAVLILEECY